MSKNAKVENRFPGVTTKKFFKDNALYELVTPYSSKEANRTYYSTKNEPYHVKCKHCSKTTKVKGYSENVHKCKACSAELNAKGQAVDKEENVLGGRVLDAQEQSGLTQTLLGSLGLTAKKPVVQTPEIVLDSDEEDEEVEFDKYIAGKEAELLNDKDSDVIETVSSKVDVIRLKKGQYYLCSDGTLIIAE